jgi:hypothetical protein
VTQVECGSKRLAPSGCLQYFTQDSGEIQTFNYNSGSGTHLANQDYSACVRNNRQYCAICYYTPAAILGFGMSLPNGISATTNLDTNCGNPGLSGTFTSGGGYDHVLIPGGQCDSPAANIVVAANFLYDKYCGTLFNCGTTAANVQAATGTVCTNQKPFKIGVLTDGLEYHNPATASEAIAANNYGFSLNYYMKTTCLTRPNQ